MKIDKNSKIAIVGNLCQNGYIIAKALRELGYAKTGLFITCKNNHIKPAQDPRFYDGLETLPQWVKVFNTRPAVKSFLTGKKIFRDYDLVIAITLSPAYVQFFNKNFVSIATGSDLREFVFEKGIYNWLLKRAYKKNKHLFFGNHDLEKQVKVLGLEKKSSQFPGPIDVSVYERDISFPKRDYLLIFWPSNWSFLKGADIFIDSMSYLFDCGYNFKVKLIDRLGRGNLSQAESEKIRSFINSYPRNIIVEKMINSRRLLIDKYYEADIVADQFVIASPGGIAREALACGRPLLASFDDKFSKFYNGESPPILNASSVQSIINKLEPFLKMDIDERSLILKNIGQKGRAWVKRYHSSEAVAEQMIKTINAL